MIEEIYRESNGEKECTAETSRVCGLPAVVDAMGCAGYMGISYCRAHDPRAVQIYAPVLRDYTSLIQDGISFLGESDSAAATEEAPEPKRPKTFVFLDLELTGTDIHKHGICQIGAVAFGESLTHFKSFFYSLCDPQRNQDGSQRLVSFDKSAMRVHGITKEQMASAPSIGDVIEKFHRWLSKYRRDTDIVFVGSGIEGDLVWIQREYSILRFLTTDLNRSIEISSLSFAIYGELMGLGRIGAKLGIKNGMAHNALADSLHGAQIFFRLQDVMSEMRAARDGLY